MKSTSIKLSEERIARLKGIARWFGCEGSGGGDIVGLLNKIADGELYIFMASKIGDNEKIMDDSRQLVWVENKAPLVEEVVVTTASPYIKGCPMCVALDV